MKTRRVGWNEGGLFGASDPAGIRGHRNPQNSHYGGGKVKLSGVAYAPAESCGAIADDKSSGEGAAERGL
jgi:hypothetical protein